MKLILQPPAKSLSRAYLKQSLKREQIELLTTNLTRMFERIRVDEHEEHLKNIVSDFLKDTWYKQSNEINTSGRADLAIHNGTTSADSVGVLIEVKRPTNKNEMISPERPNAKALHELLHYYMQERYIKDNKEILHLVVCNIYEWYIFDAVDFERFFFSNQKLVKSYKDWNDGLLVSTNTDWFYQEIARPFIEKELDELPCTYFDLREYVGNLPQPPFCKGGSLESPASVKGDSGGFAVKRLIALYKVLSPPHLLKQTFANDSNSLNKEFYSELLHIIGLEEVKEKGKKLIRRKAEGSRADGSLLENTINVLRIRNKVADDAAFEVALELCITWLNRLLFLKLLEGQLIAYHRGARSYAFLNSSRIEDFDELNELFFEVLAVRVDGRTETVRAKFGTIPYLNSSLFEESDLERTTMRINELKNRLDLPLHPTTVLKAATGKRLSGTKNTLTYLFEFLDAYDFATEGTPDIQEQNKSIINASVLGLIFEKINGYKDGSFFTPGFITMYICRETIRRAVVGKFNEVYSWNCQDITGLYNSLDKITITEANAVVNSLKICDPAVGSGHFLVSALNELVALKADLGILADSDGKRLRGYCVTIENDELIVTVDDQIFEYNFKDLESQRIQETLFHEKQTIIENCLFGVDINQKSVSICRLRLWIELLKSAYYTRESSHTELETLPNIDINIKCGNSLVSRFAITGSANVYATDRYKLKAITDRYKEKVQQYKQSPSNKHIIRKEIADLKESIQGFAVPTDPDLIALRKIKNNLDQLGLGIVCDELEKYRTMVAQEEELKRVVANRQNSVYANAFEWRYEFPEVLDEEGEFVGFDLIIGNPPYIPIEHFGDVSRDLFRSKYPQIERKFESSVLFFIEGANLLSKNGLLSFIAPLTWQTGDNYAKFRKYLIGNKGLVRIINLPFDVFEDAYIDTGIYFISAKPQKEYEIFAFDKKARIDVLESITFTKVQIDSLDKITLKLSTGRFGATLCEKFNRVEYVRLGDITKSTQGLAGSRFNKVSSEKIDAFPFLEKGNAYNYSLVKESICSVNMSDKPSLISFYQAEPKVLIRRIVSRQNRLSVAYTEEKLVFKKDINPFIPTTAKYSAKYLLGIMASKLISYVYVNSSVIATKDDFRQTTLTELRALPIPPATDAQQAAIIERVEKILTAKSRLAPLSEGGNDADVLALEAEIDHLVYALYGLTDDEIALVEGK